MNDFGPYAALLGVSFLSATLLPAQSEIMLAYLHASGHYGWSLLLITAIIGNVAGSAVNWLLGRGIERYCERRWFPVSSTALERAERWCTRWGKWSLLLSWAPIIGDPLTLIAGTLRTPFPTFLVLVSIAKAGRYALIAWALA